MHFKTNPQYAYIENSNNTIETLSFDMSITQNTLAAYLKMVEAIQMCNVLKFKIKFSFKNRLNI